MTGNLSQILGGGFDPSSVPSDEYTPIPDGDYVVAITNAEIKDTSSGGKMLVLDMEIQGGKHANRKVIERLNIVNSNETAVKIALRRLADISDSIGLKSLTDTEELIGKRLIAKISIEKGKGTYVDKYGEIKERTDQNVIKKYSPVLGSTPTQPTTPRANPLLSAQESEEIPFEAPITERPWAK